MLNKIKAYIRLIDIRDFINPPESVRLRTLSEKLKALERYEKKYCNEEKVGRLDANINKRAYKQIRKELITEIKEFANNL